MKVAEVVIVVASIGLAAGGAKKTEHTARRLVTSAAAAAPPLLTAHPVGTPPHFIVYNRIPKAGSTTLIDLFWRLQRERKLGKRYPGRLISVWNADRGDYYLEDPFEENTKYTEGWTRCLSMYKGANATLGRMYINHVFRPDFSSTGLPQPTMINMMREPIDRVISSFYYDMWGPRQAEDMVRSRKAMMDMTGMDHPPDINEYVGWVMKQAGTNGCIDQVAGFKKPKYNLQTRFFCGFSPVCADICSEAALDEAKRAMVEEYAVVGVLERMSEMLLLLELELPQWFANIGVEYGRMLEKTGHGRLRTHTKAHHELPTPETVKLLRLHNSQDVKLYAFALSLLKAAGRRHGLEFGG